MDAETLRQSALAMLAVKLLRLGAQHEVTRDTLEWLKGALQPVISAYNPADWTASCAEIVRCEHYYLLSGWAKRLNDNRQQFVSVGINGECAFECFLSDYPVPCIDAPSGPYGFRLSIDMDDCLQHGINFITLLDFDTHAVLSFQLFWHE